MEVAPVTSESDLVIADRIEQRLHAFGTPCHIVIGKTGDADELMALATQEIARLEEKFSCFEPDSIVSRINQDAGNGTPLPLDAESVSLFQYVSVLWKESSHLFDPTIRLLEDCFDDKGRQLASNEQLQKMLSLVGWSRMKLTESGACLSEKGMLIDLNSCVRPYVIDSVIKIMKRNGAQHILIEMEQDAATIGKQPDGANWLVGVRIPQGARTGIARLKMNNQGFAVRGDFEHSVLIDGERFGRALSPVDGQAIPGLLSVAVTAENSLTACSAASIARMKTEAAGLKWLERLGLPWMAIDRNLNCHGPLAP